MFRSYYLFDNKFSISKLPDSCSINDPGFTFVFLLFYIYAYGDRNSLGCTCGIYWAFTIGFYYNFGIVTKLNSSPTNFLDTQGRFRMTNSSLLPNDLRLSGRRSSEIKQWRLTLFFAWLCNNRFAFFNYYLKFTSHIFNFDCNLSQNSLRSLKTQN